MASIANDSVETACTLTDAEMKQRRAMARKTLLHHVNDFELDDLELMIVFSDIDRSDVEKFVELERQCCGFLSFEILQHRDKLVLSITGPDGSQETLKLFADAITAEKHKE